MNNPIDRHRLLSHRLRGFDTRESTAQGLVHALNAGAVHVEFDVRVTLDEALIAFHDPFFRDDQGQWRFIDTMTVADLNSQKCLSPLATLDDMCRAFSETAPKEARFHVDIKVAGFETSILDVLRKHSILDQTVIVSWIPSVLHEFHKLAPSTPLCFSHLSLTKAPWLFVAGQPFASPVVLGAFSRIVSLFSKRLTLELSSTRLHFDRDGDPITDVVGHDRTRRNHGHIVRQSVMGTMLRLLQNTSGYVCLPISLTTQALVDDYHAKGVKVAVFSAKSDSEARYVSSSKSVDLIYVDVATIFKGAASI